MKNQIFFQYAFKYLFMFIHDANIKEESIIDSNAAWTEANVVTSPQIKERKTHLFDCIWSQNVQKHLTLCYNKKKTQSLLRLLGGLRAMNWLENFIP